MSLPDILEKIAIPLVSAFIGAVLAFRYQNSSDLRKDKRLVVQNLMIYRNVGANELDWIKTINAIDIIFNDNLEVKRLYHLFLAQTDLEVYENLEWLDTYYSMVHEMSKCCGYNNLKLDEIKDFYSPIGLEQHYPIKNLRKEDKKDASDAPNPA